MTQSSSIVTDRYMSAVHWKVTNDSVMGGVSNSSINVVDNHIVFLGHISTENNGGFTSAFTTINSPLEKATHISIQVMGDGKLYQLRVKSQMMGYEVAYKIEFTTQCHVLETFNFKLADFKANFRGREINNAPVLLGNTISHVGFLVKARQPTDFSLSIYSFEFQ